MFDIEISHEAQLDLQSFRKFDQARISQEIEEQLRHEPNRETKRRKKLRSGHIAEWELRIGKIRVFYNVDVASPLVQIVRIGYKQRSKLFFRGEESLP
jgi:mRNA-degrading endonuclease RelE of RelBE toxin-antitoxin system